VTRLATLEKTIQLYDKGIVPQDRMSVEAALANYSTGGLPFVSVLEAVSTLYDDRAGLVALLADHARLLSEQEAASLDADLGSAAATAPSGVSATREPGMAAGMNGR
jgi:energy-converting hydrogenase Eha subunit F